MIQESEVFRVGKFIKPHGLKGEITAVFETDIFSGADIDYLVCNIEGIFVPFFIENVRSKNGLNAIITLEDIDSEKKAQRFSGLDAYLSRELMSDRQEDNLYSWNYFIGFEVFDVNYGRLGRIEEVDDNTINTLFIVRDGENEHLIPAVEEFIESIDSALNILTLKTPEGLIEQI